MDFSSKKNSQYFLTRLKGAIIKQCSTYDNRCSYKELKLALKSIKATFLDEQNMFDLKNIFFKNDDQIRINDIIQSVVFEGQNIQMESLIHINTDVLKETIQTNKMRASSGNQKYIKTEGDEYISEIDTTTGMRAQRSPQMFKSTNMNMNRSYITHANGFNSGSRSPSRLQQLSNYIDVQQPSVFNADLENQEEFKKIRLPRPKNLRNEINLRPFMQKDIIQNTTKIDKHSYNILDKIKLNHVGYHHMLVLEKILSELDPESLGIADKEKYTQIVRKHMLKILNEELIQEVVDYISEGDYISNTKLSGLLDAYKFAPHFPVKATRNDSENYKRKMMDHDISIPKQSNVHELYILLIEKLEEKFEKFQKAFKFFDVEQDGQIQYTEFKHTLDKLCLRFRDEEAKELFHILDKKQDGYIDYEEFCQLVPNKLELEMLDRNGESLSMKTKLIYEKFGDLQNYSQDPYRVLERSRFQNPKFMDQTTEKIGKEIFYSDKLKKVIENNIVMRKGRCDPGNALKHGYNLPSDGNQTFTYGVKSKNSENMFDIMNNNYAKEWTMDLENKRQQQEKMLNQLKQKKQTKNTYTNLLRQLHNTQTFNEESRSLSKVKKMAELTQLKPVFEKTFTQLKQRNHSALFQNSTDQKDDIKSNIGEVIRDIRTPNSCVNKDNNFNFSAKTEHFPIRSKSQQKGNMIPLLNNQRCISPNIANLNRTFTCS